jgi:cell division protein FtsB
VDAAAAIWNGTAFAPLRGGKQHRGIRETDTRGDEVGIGKLKKKLKKVSAEEKIRSLLQHYGRGLLGLLIAVMIVHDVFGTHGFLAMRRTQSEIRKVKADLDQLSKENATLEQEVKDLKTDPRLIEKIARDDLGLARPGEIIIRIPQEQQQQQREQNPAAKR